MSKADNIKARIKQRNDWLNMAVKTGMPLDLEKENQEVGKLLGELMDLIGAKEALEWLDE